jgi:hypothetical protein
VCRCQLKGGIIAAIVLSCIFGCAILITALVCGIRRRIQKRNAAAYEKASAEQRALAARQAEIALTNPQPHAQYGGQPTYASGMPVGLPVGQVQYGYAVSGLACGVRKEGSRKRACMSDVSVPSRASRVTSSLASRRPSRWHSLSSASGELRPSATASSAGSSADHRPSSSSLLSAISAISVQLPSLQSPSTTAVCRPGILPQLWNETSGCACTWRGRSEHCRKLRRPELRDHSYCSRRPAQRSYLLSCSSSSSWRPLPAARWGGGASVRSPIVLRHPIDDAAGSATAVCAAEALTEHLSRHRT